VAAEAEEEVEEAAAGSAVDPAVAPIQRLRAFLRWYPAAVRALPDTHTGGGGGGAAARTGPPAQGVGASIEGVKYGAVSRREGESWGKVVADEGGCWKLEGGRVAKKVTEGRKWRWAAVAAPPLPEAALRQLLQQWHAQGGVELLWPALSEQYGPEPAIDWPSGKHLPFAPSAAPPTGAAAAAPFGVAPFGAAASPFAAAAAASPFSGAFGADGADEMERQRLQISDLKRFYQSWAGCLAPELRAKATDDTALYAELFSLRTGSGRGMFENLQQRHPASGAMEQLLPAAERKADRAELAALRLAVVASRRCANASGAGMLPCSSFGGGMKECSCSAIPERTILRLHGPHKAAEL